MSAATAGPAVERAAAWLRGYLTSGPVRAAQVMAAARQAGYAERTLRRAARALGVRIERHGWAAGSTWTLPAGEPVAEPVTPGTDSAGPVGAPVRTALVPSVLDWRGRAVERVAVDSAATASHWDERGWRGIGEL